MIKPQMAFIAQQVNKPIKLVGCIQCFNEIEFIEANLKNHYDKFDKIIIIEGAVENRSPEAHSTDGTIEAIQSFQEQYDISKKIIFIKINRHWKSLEEMKQTFIHLTDEGDILTIIDADEFYNPADLDRVRAFFTKESGASELIVNFLHFYGDFHHVAKPGPEWVTAHQRIIKHPGMGAKYGSHPVLTDPDGYCTYFAHHYQPRRFFPKKPINIWHYGYSRRNMDDIMRGKQEYYEKELSKHNGANKKFDKKITDWFSKTEPVYDFDGDHPEQIKNHPSFSFKRDDLNVIGNWKTDELYHKVLNGEEVGNIPICMSKKAQPFMDFYHNGTDI